MNLIFVLRKLTLIAAILLAALALPAGAIPPARSAPGLAGPQPFLVLLCRFADAPDAPKPPAFFERLLFGPAPSLDDYWRAVSDERISLAGSRVIDWVALPRPEAWYRQGDGDRGRAQLAADCIDAAGQTRAARDYAGIVVVFNRNIESRPCAGELHITVEGAREHHHVIWMSPAWMRHVSAWAHEMGHVFGLVHSSDSSNAPYANPWDILSGLGGCACGAEEVVSFPQFPIADDLDRLGWIDAGRVETVGGEREITLDLAPLSEPGAAGARLVRIPTGQAGRYYTVEARARTGYDAHLPGDAVVIHRVDPACPDHPAHLITHPGEPLTTAAGMWREGETYADAAGRVAISVMGRRGAGFRVTVRTGRGAFSLPVESAPDSAAAALALWPGGKPLALAAGLGDTLYAVAAVETTLGMSPALDLAARRAGMWSAAERLPGGWSNLPGDAPAVVAGRDGIVYVAWAGAPKLFPAMGYGGVDVDIWLARRDAGGWSAPARINDDTGHATQLSPALAQGPGGALYLAWEDQRSGQRDIYFAEIAPDGRVGTNRRLNDDAGTELQSSPALAVDAQGNVTVVWADRRSGVSEIYAARRAASGAWGPNVRLVAAGLDAAAAPAVAVDAEGNAYAAWVAVPTCKRAKGEVGAIMVAFRPARGEWQPPQVVADAVHGGVESRPVIAAAGNRIYLAWEERHDAAARVRVGVRVADGWMIIRSFNAEAAKLTKPALVVDAAGTVILGWLTDTGVVFAQDVSG